MADIAFHLRVAGAVVGLALTVSITRADDFARTLAAAQDSITRGLPQASLPVLRRLPAGDSVAQIDRLLNQLCPAPCDRLDRRNSGPMLQAATDAWSLQVLGDGTAARFEDRAVRQRAHNLRREPGQQLSAANLEQAGRDYISQRLAGVIVLGSGEELVPLRTDSRVEGGTDLRSGVTARAVVASRIVFGRTIRGVPVVGGGSTVVVTFANDGSTESFQYDWPRYEAAGEQPVVPIGDILTRVQRVVAFRRGVPISATTPQPPAGGPPFTVELAPNTVLQQLDCGYYDPGAAARREGAVVQPGCVYHVLFRSEDGTRTGLSGAVPALAHIEPDTAWAETIILRNPQPGDRPSEPVTAPSR